jgi:hypothetical protein
MQTIELTLLVEKWKENSQNALLYLQQKLSQRGQQATLAEIAQSLKFDINIIGVYQEEFDCFL